MKGYIIEVRESDGNDCTVYDYIIEAESAEEAQQELADMLEARAKAGNWDADGSGGYYFPCDCNVEEPEEPETPCDSCQMLTINGVPTHETGCSRWTRYTRAMRRFEAFECPGHGGIIVAEEVEEFDSLDAAEEEHHPNRYYHSTF